MSKMEKNISFQVFFLLRRQKSRQTPDIIESIITARKINIVKK